MSVGLEFILPFLFIIGLAAIIRAVVYIVLRLRSEEPFLIPWDSFYTYTFTWLP